MLELGNIEDILTAEEIAELDATVLWMDEEFPADRDPSEVPVHPFAESGSHGWNH